MDYKDILSIREGFQASVNISYDLNDTDKVASFIPTNAALEVIEEIMLSTVDTSTQRARILTGAYGRGKSHLVLVVLALMRLKDTDCLNRILEKAKVYKPALYEFLNEYIHSSKKLLPVVISGSSVTLTQSFLGALQAALNQEDFKGILPDTNFAACLRTVEVWKEEYPDTYTKFVQAINCPVSEFLTSIQDYDVSAYETFLKIYPTLTSGSTFNPYINFDVVELYEQVAKKLPEFGYSGLYVVYDEFSKYLESSITNASMSDIKLLQDFAEKCCRSGATQMHLLLICHKDISNYIDDNLPKDKVDGWRGVSGRYIHQNVANNFGQVYEVVSEVLTKKQDKWSVFQKRNKALFEQLNSNYATSGLFNLPPEDIKNMVIKGCFPLQPLSAFLLPRISERVAQNERTLFTFLASRDRHSLLDTIEKSVGDAGLITPDAIYDYFEALFRKEPYTSSVYPLYRLCTHILPEVNSELGCKIVKTIALIYIAEQFECLAPTVDVIINAFAGEEVSQEAIAKQITELIEKDCIVYLKRSNGYLKLKEKSSADARAMLRDTMEKDRGAFSYSAALNELATENYLYPYRYNDEKELIRYFTLKYYSVQEFTSMSNWDEEISALNGDGLIACAVPLCDDERQQAFEYSKTQAQNGRVVYVVPKIYKNLAEIVLELSSVHKLQKEHEQDNLLVDELETYGEDLREIVANYLSWFTRPEKGNAEYYHLNKNKGLHRRANISELLSSICDREFPYTPVINNEAINKNELPSVAINSRKKLTSALLAQELQPRLGLTGSGQEVSITRSTLVRTGVLEDFEGTPVINLAPDDDNMRLVMETIRNFFEGAVDNGGRCLAELYDLLVSHEHHIGLKLGVVPVYMAAVLHKLGNSVIIFNQANEVRITADLLDSINVHPNEYYAYCEKLDPEKTEYFQKLEQIFEANIDEREKASGGYAYLVNAMTRWYMSLPKYTKEASGIYNGVGAEQVFSPISKPKKKFLSSLKTAGMNPREYLFSNIFRIFGMDIDNYEVIDNIAAAKKEFDEVFPRLIAALIKDTKKAFGTNLGKASTLSSVVKDWFESLTLDARNNLYGASENQIIMLAENATNDDTTLLQRLGKAVTSLRIEDWNRSTLDIYNQALAAAISQIKKFESEKTDNVNQPNMYRISFVAEDGNEVTKTFTKEECSRRAELLRNEILSSIDEMGQAITPQEKRQVLVEILEKFC